MDYTVICDANRRDGTIAAIHRAGCRDIQADINSAAHTVNLSGSLRDALDVAVDAEDRDLGYGDVDVKVYPCAAAAEQRETAAAEAEEEALDMLHDIAQHEDDDTGETVDVVIAVGDDYAPRLDILAADVDDALRFEGATIHARVVGESAWKGERETAIWFAATVPANVVPALRASLRVIARRHKQEAIALTVGTCELLG